MRLHRLASGSSLAVLAAMLGTQPVLGAAYQGNPTTTLGSVSYDRATLNVDTITVDSAQATINWTPTDTGIGGGGITFLANTGTANYVAGSNAAGGYTVLNRIIAADPSRSIVLDGAVNSAAGGSVWFYAPGGILVGQNARFNVGSLLLSASDPVTGGGGQFLTGGSFSVAGVAGSQASVLIAPGAQINALNQGSYVVAVAPRISQDGAIRVNGSAALVAAESVDFTYNGGLFDITVTQGTTAGGGTPLIHDGSTGGPVSTGATDYHRIYLVAVPKNVALTLFLGGPGNNLGFDVAGAADVVGNAIVLSAGHNVVGVASGDPFSDLPAGGVTANLHVNEGDYTSQVTGRSNGDTFASALDGDTFFRSNVDLRGVANAHLNARDGNTITVAGNATVSAAAQTGLTAGASRTAGFALVNAEAGSTLTIGGNVSVDATAIGDGNITGIGATGSAQGGTARIAAFGGSIVIGGFAQAHADGFAGSGESAGIDGGTAVGGLADIDAVQGGSVQIAGAARITADAIGGRNRGGGDLIGGSGTGGSARAFVNTNGTLTIGGTLVASASGRGGVAVEGTTGGSGVGGTINFSASGSVVVNNSVTFAATGVGGDGVVGGAGSGGMIDAYISTLATDTINITGNSARFDARAFGGIGDSSSGRGGDATGGTARVTADNGQFTITAPTNILAMAGATGGSGATGGNAVGGTAAFRSNGGVLRLAGPATASAGAIAGGGLNGNGGNANAGSASASTFSTGSGSIAFQGALSLYSGALGGNGGGATGNGGNATGGTSSLNANGGNVSVAGSTFLSSDATGGDGINGGSATAGDATSFVRTATLAVQALTYNSTAYGGNGSAGGAGGAATGGLPGFLVQSDPAGNSVMTATAISLDGSATGGAGGAGAAGQAGGAGGAAVSGRPGTEVRSYSGFLTANTLTVRALSTGGTGGAGGFAGNGASGAGGAGGNATNAGPGNASGSTSSGTGGTTTDGVITLGAVSIDASSFGGAGGAGGSGPIAGNGGAGGAASGGNALYLARGGTATLGALTLTSRATGGDGGTSGGAGAVDGAGGNATGGFAWVAAAPHFYIPAPANLTIASVNADASATGGASAFRAGNGTGGNAELQLTRQGSPAPQPVTTGSLTVNGNVLLVSDGTGGASPTGQGGSGTGGTASLTSVDGATQLAFGVVARANGMGGASAQNGGSGLGGSTLVTLDGGTLGLVGGADLRAGGFGASGAIIGGTGTGGTAGINVGATTGGALSSGMSIGILAEGFGGSGVNGAAATGGAATVTVGTTGSLMMTGVAPGDRILSLYGLAEGGPGTAGSGGNGVAGTVGVTVNGSGLVSVGNLDVYDEGDGGGAALTFTGGLGRGGSVNLTADGNGATLDVERISLEAGGLGGYADATTGTGGAARGGQIIVQAQNGGRIRQLLASQRIFASADADGGNGATGGAATAGTIGAGTFLGGQLLAAEGQFEARAIGGYGSNGNGGDANGGTITAGANPGTLTIDGTLSLSSGADGGSGTHNGGAATGGTSLVFASAGGTVGLGALDVNVVTRAGDGAGAGSTGGLATGGSGRLAANGGAITVAGTVDIDASITGGRGAAGGNAVGGPATVGDPQNGNLIVGSATVAASGGSVTIGGTTQLNVTTIAGDALAGFGGKGGDAFGGVTVFSVYTPNTTAVITGGDVFNFARAAGGAGGSGGAGVAGGAGGAAQGGSTYTGSSTSAGTVTAGAYANNISGTGGAGGAGGSGASGGAGGAGRGGSATIAAGNTDASTLTGAFSYALLNLNGSGVGGAGGLGGGPGLGGSGGAGTGGTIVVTTSGGVMTIANETLVDARGVGGAAGAGGIGGNGVGGHAFFGAGPHSVIGGVSRLTGGDLSVTVDAQAGTGATAGATTYGTVLLFASSGATSFASAALSSAGEAAAPTSPGPSGIVTLNGPLTIAGDATLSTGGDAALGADLGDITVGGLLRINAAGSIVANYTGAPYTVPGTVHAGMFDLNAAADIITPVGLETPGDLNLAASGLLSIGNLTAANVFAASGTSNVSVGDVVSAGDLELNAPGSLTTGALRGAFDVRLNAGDAIATGALSAGDSVLIFGNAGDIVTGAVDAGLVAPSADADAGYGVLIAASDGNVTTGNIAAAEAVGLVANGGSIVAGGIDAPLAIGLLASGSVDAGALRTAPTGSILIADASLASLLVEAPNGNVDYSALLVATPVPIAGAVTIGGSVTTGDFRSASLGALTIQGLLAVSGDLFAQAGSLDLGDITVPGTLELETTGALTTGNVISGGFIGLTSGAALSVGNVRGEDDIELTAADGVTAGNVGAADSVFITAGGPVVTGRLEAGLVDPSIDPAARYGILVDATGSATVGGIGALGAAGIVARGGSILVGDADVGLSFGLLAGADVTTGAIRTGRDGTTLIAADTMAALVVPDADGNPDYSALLTATPVRLAGRIAVGGPAVTGVFKAAATGNFSAGAITAGTSVSIDSGSLASFGGVVTGPAIAVRSADIAIGANASLGSAATTALTLAINPAAGAIRLGGGPGNGPGWLLDNAEAGRLQASALTITALSGGVPLDPQTGIPGNGNLPPTMIIDALALRPGGTVTLTTPGAIRVVGAAGIGGAGSGDVLRLQAGTRLEVAADSGGALEVTAGGGAPAGRLELTAPDIWVADTALLTRLEADPVFAGRDLALAQASATPNLGGALTGDRIVVSTARLLVQNSGSPLVRAGFTAGSGGVAVSNPEDGSVELVVNGRAGDGAGGFAVNGATRDFVVVTGTPTGNSTINGCGFDGVCAQFDNTTTETIADITTSIADQQALTDDRDATQDDPGTSPELRLARLIDVGSVASNAALTEPVTSGGNPALWTDPAPAAGPGVKP